MIAVFEALAGERGLILRRAFMHFSSTQISRRIAAVLFVLVVMFAAAQSAFAQTETVLYSFGLQSGDGTTPWDSLIMDTAGNLYGTTTEGGATSHCDYGCGTVFKLSPEKAGS
jgi:uncharacterized repeat protein (TIGR03803 family)